MLGMICLQYPFIEYDNKTNFSCALFATLAYPLFLIGMQHLVIMTLVGRAKFIRVVFGANFWTVTANMTAACYMIYPLVCLFYYSTVEHQVTMRISIMWYYFCGNLVFTLVFGFIAIILVDRPTYQIIEFDNTVNRAKRSTRNSIAAYVDIEDERDSSHTSQKVE